MVVIARVGSRASAVAVAIQRSAAIVERRAMFDLRDLFQWDRFITPSIIKIFYWLAVGLSVLFGLSGIFSGLALMLLNPIQRACSRSSPA